MIRQFLDIFLDSEIQGLKNVFLSFNKIQNFGKDTNFLLNEGFQGRDGNLRGFRLKLYRHYKKLLVLRQII